MFVVRTLLAQARSDLRLASHYRRVHPAIADSYLRTARRYIAAARVLMGD